MATINNVKERLAAALGISVSVIERELRALREAGWTPAGKPGGGVGAAHYSKLHLTYVILGLAAARHSEAPDAVLKLRGLPLRGVQNAPPDVAAALPTLEDQIADWIDGLAAPYRRGMHWLPDSLAKIHSWELQFCLDPRHAIIKYGVTEPRTVYLYAASPTPTPVLRRFVVLTGEVLLAAAELLADTEVQQAAVETATFLDATRPAKADQEQENAGHPRQRVPASLDHPLAKGAGGSSNTPELSPERRTSQGTALGWNGQESTSESDLAPF